MDNDNKNRKYLLMLPVVAAAMLAAGLWAGRYLTLRDREDRALDKLTEVFDMVTDCYVDDVDTDSLVELTLPQLIHNLDPHSAYIAASDRKIADRDLESSFYGIGIQFQLLNDSLYIVEVISGGAAESAGILAGDRIIEVDGREISGSDLTNESVFTMLRGEKDSTVDVKVKRKNSAKPLSFELVRGEIPVSPVDAEYMANDSIGYVKIGKFSDNTYSEFLQALGRLRHRGAKAFVIDLRGNGGGYMNPAVLMANEFFDSPAIIVMTRGRNFSDNSVLATDLTGSFGTEQLVVLIDEFTASASEIFAGAIQDNDRGLIIGRRSFGKGLVQRSFDMPDSSQIRLTVQRYYTPSGRCIQKGYTPGKNVDYESEIFERYNRGEVFSADSMRRDSTDVYRTRHGREVFGGGGIIPDIFVPSDTSGVTNYYVAVANAGLLQKFAYEYCDLNRENLDAANSLDALLSKLPSDPVLLQSFVNYASTEGGIRPRWYYINISQDLIVNQIKAIIARDILGFSAYFELMNRRDPVVNEAISRIERGEAATPVTADIDKAVNPTK
ncbi:MAG: S41 family peptidase [Muribaculaceae bacterium]